jgi:FtsP/CotA-like multicopper oxidase with cupredoxin domain
MRKVLFILIITCSFTCFSQTTVEYNMKMWTTYSATMWDDSTVATWGFSEGSNYPPLPGPTLYANEGDSVIINIRNQSQPYHHTVHLHGLDVDQANDGVPQTSFALPHMHDSTYRFKATHAGTYLYHCHVASIVHVQMGMYGNVIINAANGAKTAYTNGPGFDREYNWLMSEIDKSWHDSIPFHHDKEIDSVYAEFTVPDYNPNYFLVNGKAKQQIKNDSLTSVFGGVNETIFIRLSNVGYYMNEVIFPAGVNAEIIMSDGRALPQSELNDTLYLTPGERYGVLLSFNNTFSDSIAVHYYDMNFTDNDAAVEYIPIEVVLNPGINKIENINITATPNPSSIFSINGVAYPTPFVVYDINGKVIISKTISAKTSTVDLSTYKNGIYFFSFDTPEYTKTIKVIKQ